MSDDSDTRPRPATGKRPQSAHRAQQARREFIRTAVLSCGMIGAGLLGFLPVVQAGDKRLRPPRHPLTSGTYSCIR